MKRVLRLLAALLSALNACFGGAMLRFWRSSTLSVVLALVVAGVASQPSLAQPPLPAAPKPGTAPLILETQWPQTPFHPGDFVADACSHKRFLADNPPAYEWMPLLPGDDKIVGLSGTAFYLPEGGGAGISQNDIWFTHPFGFDWEFFVAPDIRYTTLLAPGNNANQGEFGEAIKIAQAWGGYAGGGVLGVELDRGLVPQAYRVTHGGRVAIFGTWAADCGHTDYHAEIHPPLLIVQAGAAGTETTKTRLIGRPFTITQEFGDGALRQHLLNEFEKLNTFRSKQMEAHVQVDNVPFRELKLMSWIVRPPSPRRQAGDRLVTTFQFTVRTGVSVQVAQQGDEIHVYAVMNDALYKPAPLPRSWSTKVELHQIISAQGAEGAGAVAAMFIPSGANPLDPFAATALAIGGVLYTSHDFPVTKPHNVTYTLGVPGPQFLVDDSQPFPIYGWLDVTWRRQQPPPTIRNPVIGLKPSK